MKIRQFIKNTILFLIQLIEKIEYKNTNLEEKILNSIELKDIKIETDSGFKEVSHIHITKPFEIYDLYLNNNLFTAQYKMSLLINGNYIEEEYNKYSFKKDLIPDLSCADTHIVFDKNMNEIFVKDLKEGDFIQTKTGLRKVLKVVKRKQKVSMFDITVNDDKHRFYSNDILSHNTIMSAIYIAHYILFNFDRNVFLIANIQKTSKEVMDKVKVIIENLPFFMKPGIVKNDVMEMKFDNGCRLITAATTKRSAIGFVIHLLYLDEFAHVAENIQKEFYQNIYPTISSSKISKIIITSTPNGFNLFYDIYSMAEKGESEYAAFRIDWWEVPGRDEKWYKDTLANLGGSEQAFNEQYGNSFITADSRLLSPNHIERLEKEKVKYVLREFEELLDLELDYEKYLAFHPDFNIEKAKDKESFFLFSIDIAEGGGGSSDSSVINIFEIDAIQSKFIKEIANPTSFHDFFGLSQVGRFESNEISIEDFCKIAYILIFDIFYSENVKVILEMNTYGGEFLKTIQSVFPGSNEFDDETIVKFKHKSDSNLLKMGLKLKPDNKPIIAQKFKKYYHTGRIILSDIPTVTEAMAFGKDKRGMYKGLLGHDDLIMTCINSTEFFTTMDFSDFVEEKYDLISDNIRLEITTALKQLETDSDSLQYDIYSVIDDGGNGFRYSDNDDDLDFF